MGETSWYEGWGNQELGPQAAAHALPAVGFGGPHATCEPHGSWYPGTGRSGGGSLVGGGGLGDIAGEPGYPACWSAASRRTVDLSFARGHLVSFKISSYPQSSSFKC